MDTSLPLVTGMLTICEGAPEGARTGADMTPSGRPGLGAITGANTAGTPGAAGACGISRSPELATDVTSTGIAVAAGVIVGGTDITSEEFPGTIGADTPPFVVVSPLTIEGDSKGGTTVKAVPLTASDSEERGAAAGVMAGIAMAILPSCMGGAAIETEDIGARSAGDSNHSEFRTGVDIGGTSAVPRMSPRTGPGLCMTYRKSVV